MDGGLWLNSPAVRAEAITQGGSAGNLACGRPSCGPRSASAPDLQFFIRSNPITLRVSEASLRFQSPINPAFLEPLLETIYFSALPRKESAAETGAGGRLREIRLFLDAGGPRDAA